MSSTSRYGLEPAPGGLGLLQDLVNTRGVPAYGVPDLLATADDAGRWFAGAVADWARQQDGTRRAGDHEPPDLAPTEAARRALVALRDRVTALLTGDRSALAATPATVASGPDGLRLEPRGRGVAWLASAVAAEALLAERAGDLARLKTCRNRHCPCAFFDRSRNNSRVWHDVHTCGNAANLRASRARRRASGG